MVKPPLNPDVLPTMNHANTKIFSLIHHGFSRPEQGPAPQSRTLYGACDKAGERHWRGSYHEITSLIDRGFAVAPLASGIAS